MNTQKLSLYGPLPIRILAGIAFIAHGLPKLVDPAMTQGFFGNIGLPPEMAVPIGVLKVVGGFAILLGILTRIASILFIIEMIGAPLLTKISEGFVGGYELDLLLMAISISLLLTGPGKISIEYDILRRELFPKGEDLVRQVKYHETNR
ncbi:MAG: DoxX family membrane protein [Nitrososphaeraceae archaeon]|nr:DoxX family membrane protein [Nitrososphaeraceae archaeon]